MAQSQYTGVPTVNPTSGGSGATYQSVPEANAAAFGAQIGEAEQKLGATGQEVGNKGMDLAGHFAEMATRSKAENDFASQYATGASALRKKFDMLDDKDKVSGSVDYINGLNALGQSFTGDEAKGSPFYKQTMSGLIGRHIFSETTGINREVVNSTLNLAAQSKMAVISTNNGYAAANYDDSAVVDQMAQSNSGLRTLQVMDAGHDINSPDSKAILEEYQRNDIGLMADGMVKAAVSQGNISSAMRIRATYNDAIPGYKQLQTDGIIHAVSMQQFGSSGNSSLAAGGKIPEVVGAPPSAVQALVANTAHTSGINPNDALTVARIESSMGTNVGSRGTLGQDKGSAGQSLDVQAKALCDNWKAARNPAATALGREPEGWEQYTVYQQGSGGGAALLKADPNAKAMDVLSQFYPNPKTALAAITGNGGNATMSVSDFLNQEKQRWNDSAERAKCDFNDNSPPGDQILAAHQNPGATVQPAADPVQDYRNWQKANITNIQQIMAMPSGPAREALLRENQFQTAKREGASNAYNQQLITQATQMMADPKFSMDQVKPETYTALAQDHPQTLIAMQTRARENAERADPAAKEALQKGAGFHELNVGTQEGAEIRTTPEMINKAYNEGKLNSEAQDYLLSKIVGKKSLSPEEDTYKKNSLEYAKASLQYQAYDPASVAAYSNFNMALDQYVTQAKTAGKSLHEIYDPKNLDPLIKQFEPKYADILPQPEEHKGFLGRLFSSTPQQLAVPDQKSLVSGQTYDTPKYGKLIWTGTGFVKPPEGSQ